MNQTVDTASASPPLEGNVRSFIVLLALLQALLLYLASKGTESGWWPFSALGGRVYWYTLVLTVPTVMVLSVQRLGDRRFWQQALGVLVAYALLAAWAARTATAEMPVQASSVLVPFGATLAIAAFILTPYLQARLAHGRWCAPYPRLFEDAWQNGLALILAGALVGLGWGLLTLWAELFKLIGIVFFDELFRERPFRYLATGLLFGLGVMIGRTQHRPVQMARVVLFALFKGLLPVLALVVLMFLLSLPFTGLEPLWNRQSGIWRGNSVAVVLSSLLAFQVLFLNAVYQDGEAPPPYPRWLRWVVEASLVAMPLFAFLAIRAVWMRLGEYGWTGDRYWALMAVTVLFLYALGYAVAVLWRRQRWLARLPQVNVAVSLAIVAVVLLGNGPLLDPHRLGAASQVARLQAMPAEDVTWRDLEWLRFDAGRHGVAALRRWRESDGLDEALATRVDRLLAIPTRHARWPEHQQESPEAVAARLRQPANAEAAIPEDFLDYLRKEVLGGHPCRANAGDCLVLALDGNFDGVDEQMLCLLDPPSHVTCTLHAEDGTGWSQISSVHWYGDAEATAVARSLRAGEISVQPSPWGVLAPQEGAWRRIPLGREGLVELP